MHVYVFVCVCVCVCVCAVRVLSEQILSGLAVVIWERKREGLRPHYCHFRQREKGPAAPPLLFERERKVQWSNYSRSQNIFGCLQWYMPFTHTRTHNFVDSAIVCLSRSVGMWAWQSLRGATAWRPLREAIEPCTLLASLAPLHSTSHSSSTWPPYRAEMAQQQGDKGQGQ